jgi:hypothetical protein
MFHSDDEFITNLFNAHPSMGDRPLEPTGVNLCQRCSHAVHQLLLDFTTSADGLSKSAVQCDLCRLLFKILGERLPKEMKTEPLGIRKEASKITVQRGLHSYRLLTIRKIPGREALNIHMIGLRRLTSFRDQSMQITQ